MGWTDGSSHWCQTTSKETEEAEEYAFIAMYGSDRSGTCKCIYGIDTFWDNFEDQGSEETDPEEEVEASWYVEEERRRGRMVQRRNRCKE